MAGKSKNKNVLEHASLISKLTFFYALKLLRIGFLKDIDENDIYEVEKTYKSGTLGDRLEEEWNKENLKEKPHILKPILRIFIWRYVIAIAPYLVATSVLMISKPLLLGKVLYYFSANDANSNEVIIYSAALSICVITYTIVHHFSAFGTELTDLKAKAAMCSLIYKKSLKLKCDINNSCGQAVTLMTKDVVTFEYLAFSFYQTISGPIMIIAMTTIMYTKIGVAAVLGTFFLLLLIPLQAYLGTKVSWFKLQTSEKTDQRIQQTQEALNSIQAIKMYSWEKFFINAIMRVRSQEIHYLRFLYYMKAAALSVGQISSKVALYICIITYINLGNHITAEKAFVVIECLATLHLIVMYNFPKGIAHIAEFVTALRRITSFLQLPEVDLKKDATTSCDKAQIEITKMTVKSPEGLDILREIQLRFKKGLNIVTGLVGSGKSTLFKAILGEVELNEGSIKIEGKISYAGQQPWIFPGTVKQNIIFAEQFDQERYKEVIRVCGLKHDLDIFLNGDLTCVTDRGLNLSGGQKARICLARAIYKEADIYLLDDSLASIDIHISSVIFNDCIEGFLKDKVCVFASHQPQYLQEGEQIVILSEGSVKFQGSYNELQACDDNEVKTNLKGKEKVDPHEALTRDKSIRGKRIVESTVLSKRNVYEETKQVGSVKKEVYFTYFLSGGGFKMFLLVLVLAVTAQAALSWTEVFISTWVSIEKNLTSLENNNLTDIEEYVNVGSQYYSMLRNYSIMILVACTLTAIKTFILFFFCGNISKNLHTLILEKIIRAKMVFFNCNLAGNILNRFSRDLAVIDETLPYVLFEVSMVLLMLLSVIIVTSIVNQIFLIPSIVFASLLVLIRLFYIPTGRSVKRLQGTTRSAVVGHTKATFEGLTTIRASSAEIILYNQFASLQDHFNGAFHMTLITARTFAFYCDLFCSLFIAAITLSFPFLKTDSADNNFAGNVGLALTQSLALTGYLQWGVRQWAELEIQMTSTERVLEYTQIDTEEETGSLPPATWPNAGKIQFKDVSLKYHTGDIALRDLSLEIEPKQKVGIVGRTGAGKSSVISALLQIYKHTGSISIDEVNLETVPLKVLRSKIAVIPQDPILFSGTLRSNLDPYNEYTDKAIWDALEEVNMKRLVEDLEINITEGGLNFSTGQRQLLCLARAILRNNLILLLDEATANIDPETDNLIQRTIKTKFANCTVITIAHRLNTIMDSDKIVVIDAGKIVEFDPPKVLLKNGGLFRTMVKEAGLL